MFASDYLRRYTRRDASHASFCEAKYFQALYPLCLERNVCVRSQMKMSRRDASHPTFCEAKHFQIRHPSVPHAMFAFDHLRRCTRRDALHVFLKSKTSSNLAPPLSRTQCLRPITHAAAPVETRRTRLFAKQNIFKRCTPSIQGRNVSVRLNTQVHP
jgi:hypothetical protein